MMASPNAAFSQRPATVRRGLLLGAAPHEREAELLRKQGVTHILQVGTELKPSHPDQFEYLRLAISDTEQEDILRLFPRCFKFISAARQSGGCVLVHCMAGMSRSATVVIGYLMATERLPYAAALAAVKAVRPCVYPNLGFLLQLWEWERLGCDLAAWTGWGAGRHAERLAEYRRAQKAANLHPAVRVRLPMAPPPPAPSCGGGCGGAEGAPAPAAAEGERQAGEGAAPAAALEEGRAGACAGGGTLEAAGGGGAAQAGDGAAAPAAPRDGCDGGGGGAAADACKAAASQGADAAAAVSPLLPHASSCERASPCLASLSVRSAEAVPC